VTHKRETMGADEPVAEALRSMEELSYRELAVPDGKR
jgi:hypothetical protein